MTPEHKYLDDGKYNVSLTIKYNTDGATKQFWTQLIVNNIPPEANFFTSSKNTFIGEQITFDASTTIDKDDTEAELKYSWVFNDGNTAVGKEVIHSFSDADTYLVLLTVTDDDGATSEYSMEIIINEHPSPVNVTDDEGISLAGLVLIIIGVLAVILVVSGLVLFMMIRRKSQEEEPEDIEEE
jgi:PKD repeat protein